MRPRHDNGLPGEENVNCTVRAAQYVRMSTEHQQYSTENQADRIRDYAERRGIAIVRTYADEGKSGLNIGGREDAPPKQTLRRSAERAGKAAATVEVVLPNGRMLRVSEAIAPEVLGRLAAALDG